MKSTLIDTYTDINGEWAMELHRRNFEAKKYPKYSELRNQLNESILTSEYAPSKKFVIVKRTKASDTMLARTTYRSYETKKLALAVLNRGIQ